MEVVEPVQGPARTMACILGLEVLTPGGFNSLTRLRDRLLRFQEHGVQVAQPFQWKFTRQALNRLTGTLSDYEVGHCRAACAAGNTSPNSPGEAP